MGTRATVSAGSLLAGRYRLVEPLPDSAVRGWRARDDISDRDVAARELPLGPGDPDEVRQRTMRRVRDAARLRHGGIAAVYDVVEHDGVPWVVLELVAAPSLDHVLRTRGPVTPVEAARIGLRVLEALEAADAAGVRHRDLTPASVLVGGDGRVTVAGFGLTPEPEHFSGRPAAVTGSVDFVAPERARGVATGGIESDLWSLGATLYAAVEGKLPFHRAAALATLTAVVTDEPPPPQRARALRPVIDGLLIKDPAHRLGMAEARRMLDGVVRGVPVLPDRRPVPAGHNGAAQRSGRPVGTIGSSAVGGSAAGPAARPAERTAVVAGDANASAAPGDERMAEARTGEAARPSPPADVETAEGGAAPDGAAADEPVAAADVGAKASEPVAAADVGAPIALAPIALAPTAGTPTAGTPTAGTPTAGTPTAGTPTAGTSTAGTSAAQPPAGGTTGASTPDAGHAVGAPTSGTAAGAPPAAAPGTDSAGRPEAAGGHGPADGGTAAETPDEAGRAASVEEQDAAAAEYDEEIHDPEVAAALAAFQAALGSLRPKSPDAVEHDDEPAAAGTPASQTAAPHPARPPAPEADEDPAPPLIPPLPPVAGRPVARPMSPQRAPVPPLPPAARPVNGRPAPAMPSGPPIGGSASPGAQSARNGLAPPQTGPVRPAHPGPTPIPTPPQPRIDDLSGGSSTRRRSVLTVVAVVLAVIAAVLIPYLIDRSREGGIGSALQATPAPAHSTVSPSSAPSPEAAAPPPAGFRLHRDPTGFSIAVPNGWREERDGSIVDFRDPTSSRFIRIDQRVDPRTDPYDDWVRLAPAYEQRLPGYDLNRIANVQYRGWRTADWEFTWGARGSERSHVIIRNVVPNEFHGYALYWSTADRQWVKDLPYFDIFVRTFAPKAGR